MTMNPEQQKLIDACVLFVKNELQDGEKGHDWWHVERVWRTSRLIAETEPVDGFVVELAALLHDIADSKFHAGDEEIGPQKAKTFLQSQGVPSSVVGHVVDIIRHISFKGGNQFRNFDIKSLQYQTEHIARISYDTTNQVYLLADQLRTFKQYAFEKDLNGGYFIKNEDHAEFSHTEADYAWVHFFLPYPAMITTGTFHILGELTSWQLDNSSRMYFNPEHKGYELNLFLKQGYYNYLYALKENGKKQGDVSLIEGSHWETENDYTIFVYFHETGSLFDRLISVNVINTIRP